MGRVSIVWELPFALVSRLLLLITRWGLRRIARLHFHLARTQASQWRLLSAEFLRQPLVLPVVMTEGPRWNTHATIGRIGPLLVRESLRLNCSQVDAAAQRWTIVVYTFPSHRTVTWFGPSDDLPEDGWRRLNLPPGRYSLISRYYDVSPSAVLPAIEVDGEPAVASTPVPMDTNDFYQHLSRRRRPLYAMLHYHAYVFLKHRARLPTRWVEQMYLPVGNPETRFQYGALARNERVEFRVGRWAREHSDVYVTVYNVASFPLAWQTISDDTCRLGPFGRLCTYLLRIHPRPGAPAPPDDVDVLISVTKTNRNPSRSTVITESPSRV